MRYLLDTNVWMECLLDGERADEVKLFLSTIPSDELCISDLAFHSIALAHQRAEVMNDFLTFINDLFIKNNVSKISLDYLDYEVLADLVDDGEMDYEDAYHYISAKNQGLILISLNANFKDKGDIQIRTPAKALHEKVKAEKK